MRFFYLVLSHWVILTRPNSSELSLRYISEVWRYFWVNSEFLSFFITRLSMLRYNYCRTQFGKLKYELFLNIVSHKYSSSHLSYLLWGFQTFLLQKLLINMALLDIWAGKKPIAERTRTARCFPSSLIASFSHSFDWQSSNLRVLVNTYICFVLTVQPRDFLMSVRDYVTKYCWVISIDYGKLPRLLIFLFSYRCPAVAVKKRVYNLRFIWIRRIIKLINKSID